MKIIEVIKAHHWRHKATGETAPLLRDAPLPGDTDTGDWEAVTEGYTWLLDNGTVGLGRRPAATRAEAEAVMLKVNGNATEERFTSLDEAALFARMIQASGFDVTASVSALGPELQGVSPGGGRVFAQNAKDMLDLCLAGRVNVIRY